MGSRSKNALPAPATGAYNSHPGKTVTPVANGSRLQYPLRSADSAIAGQPRVDGCQRLFANGRVGQRQQRHFVDGGRQSAACRDRTCGSTRLRRRRTRRVADDRLPADRHRECRRAARTRRASRRHRPSCSRRCSGGRRSCRHQPSRRGGRPAPDRNKTPRACKLHHRCTDRRDNDPRRSGGDLPQRFRARFLNLGMRRHDFRTATRRRREQYTTRVRRHRSGQFAEGLHLRKHGVAPSCCPRRSG